MKLYLVPHSRINVQLYPFILNTTGYGIPLLKTKGALNYDITKKSATSLRGTALYVCMSVCPFKTRILAIIQFFIHTKLRLIELD